MAAQGRADGESVCYCKETEWVSASSSPEGINWQINTVAGATEQQTGGKECRMVCWRVERMHTDNRAETITFRYFKPNHHVSLTLTKCLLCRDIRTAEDPGGLLKPVSFHSWIVDTKARFMRQKCTKADSVTGDQTDVRCSTSSSQVLSSSDTSWWV